MTSSASAALLVSGVMPKGMLAASSNGGGRLDASEPSIAGDGLPSASRVSKLMEQMNQAQSIGAPVCCAAE